MAIARQMSIAIENHELVVKVQRNLERIRALHEIDKAIVGSLDLGKVLNVLLEKVDVFLEFPAAPAGVLLPINHRQGTEVTTLLLNDCARRLNGY
jgi:hypothetical protein